MEKTQHPSVYLTMQHLDPQHVRQRFPGIAEVCRKFGLDIATDRIPVRPGAHYMIGGVVVDDHGQTTIPGLLAAGEVTSTGLHGANRLASNSLLEGLVFGKRAGSLASRLAVTTQGRLEVPAVIAPELPAPDQPLDLSDVRNAVQSLMWRKVGVERNQQRLAEAVEGLEGYCRYALANPQQTIEGWELQNLLTVSLMMAHAALAREESRGVHLRTDFPNLDDLQWRRHLVFQREST
jgi:L-aspartate oxidase